MNILTPISAKVKNLDTEISKAAQKCDSDDWREASDAQEEMGHLLRQKAAKSDKPTELFGITL